MNTVPTQIVEGCQIEKYDMLYMSKSGRFYTVESTPMIDHAQDNVSVMLEGIGWRKLKVHGKYRIAKQMEN